MSKFLVSRRGNECYHVAARAGKAEVIAQLHRLDVNRQM